MMATVMMVQKSHFILNFVIAFHIPNQALLHILGEHIDFVGVGAQADFGASVKNRVHVAQILRILNAGLVLNNYAVGKLQEVIGVFAQESAIDNFTFHTIIIQGELLRPHGNHAFLAVGHAGQQIFHFNFIAVVEHQPGFCTGFFHGGVEQVGMANESGNKGVIRPAVNAVG